MEQKNEALKKEVEGYWNAGSCGTEVTQQTRYSKEYFEEIEDFRYRIEPEIFSFAQFTRFHGKKLLEVGVGAGSDFLQWVRAGTHATGIDLTHEAIYNVQERLKLYGLSAEELKVADAENLPFKANSFDVVYSWGVIHHSPNTPQCLAEIIRVTKPGGTIKVMVYNRRSLFALYRYLLAGLFKGKPFQSFSKILWNYQESPGTKAYTFAEVRKMIEPHSVDLIELKATVSQHDLLYYKNWFIRGCAYIAACFGGWNRVGWFMTIELKKK